jgi:hypothetical protein
MEGYFKLAIKELIDSGEPFISNAEKEFTDTKINLAIFKAIHGKRITVGEFLSHNLAFSSLEEINKKLSALINMNFLEQVKTIHDRFDVEVRKLPQVAIIQNPDRTIKNTRKLFEIRHIICHELATDFDVSISDIDEQFEDCLSFLKASEQLLSNVLYPNSPLTQSDINRESARQVEETKNIINDLLIQAKAILDKDEFQTFERSESIWKKFSESWAEVNSNNFKGGSISPSIHNGILVDLSNFRAKQILKYLKTRSSN